MRQRHFFLPEMTKTMYAASNPRQFKKRSKQRKNYYAISIICCMFIACLTLLQLTTNDSVHSLHKDIAMKNHDERGLSVRIDSMESEPSQDQKEETDPQTDETSEEETETSLADSEDMNESQFEGGFVNIFNDLMQTLKYTDIPYLIRDGKLHCRQGHMDELNKDRGSLRYRWFGQMIHAALQVKVDSDDHYGRVVSKIKGSGPGTGLPIIAKWGDGCGCTNKNKDYRFLPKLTWSFPIPPIEGCNTLGVPGYRAWQTSLPMKSEAHWDLAFQRNDEKYPWSKKKKKALWRGGTTGRAKLIEGKKGEYDFFSLPRTMLVQKSIENPHIIDAAFHKMTQHFAKRKDLEKMTRIAPGVPMEEFMKYRAIIDIDGNGWSSRYGELLCMNSVVIKVRY